MTMPRRVPVAIGIFLVSLFAFYSPHFLKRSQGGDSPPNGPSSKPTIEIVDSFGGGHIGRTYPPQAAARKKRSVSGTSPGRVINTSDPLLTNPNKRVYKGAKGHYWLGVPYAKNFQTGNSLNENAEMDEKPQPRNLEYGKVCPQPARHLQDGSIYPPFPRDAPSDETLPTLMDVNCLRVNIFTPLFVTDPPTDVFHPVLVLFSGGPYGLDGGSSRRYGLHGPMSNLVAPGKMVVVVVQSRLGPLGYYRPPNASLEWSPPALMDLLLAMKWVRNNIAKFGGNASAVTLMGEGGGACGASMVALAAMQPKAGELHGLFKRVLLLGGVADTCVSSAGSSESNSRRLERRLCAGSITPDAITKCMEGKSWHELIEASDADNLHWGYELDDSSRGIFRLPDVMFSNADSGSGLVGPKEFYYLLHRDEWAADGNALMQRMATGNKSVQGYGEEFAEEVLAKVLGGKTNATRKIIDTTLRLYEFDTLASNFSYPEDAFRLTMEMMGDALYTTAVLRDVQRASYERKNQLIWFTHPSVVHSLPNENFSVTPAGSFTHYAFLPDYLWSGPSANALTDEQLARELRVVWAAADFIHTVVRGPYGGNFVSATFPTTYLTMVGESVEVSHSGFIRPNSDNLEEHWGIFRGHLPAGDRLTPAYVTEKVMGDKKE